MRVLHVINSLGASGGAEHGLVREITRFSNDMDQTVVRLFEKDQLDGVLLEAGIEVKWLGLSPESAGWMWPIGVLRLRRMIAEFHPDVVHTSLFMGNLVGQLAAISSGIPVVSTLTLSGDVSLLRQYQPGAHTRRAAILRRIASRAAHGPRVHFRAITEHVRTTSIDAMNIPDTRVVVVPRGLGPEVTPRASPDRARFGIPEGVPLLVNVGRQSAQKGHLHLLGAFQLVLEEHPEARLLIAGREGDATAAISQELARRDLVRSVGLLGYRDDVDVLLASGDVFVFTSMMEGLGTAVLEAMRARVPVVAFDIPPVREVTDDGRLAHLVRLGDEAALAECVLGVLGHEADSRTSAAAQTVAERFAVDVVARRVEELLRASSVR